MLFRSKPRLEQFQFVYNSSKNPVCYNGDIRTCINATDILNEYPKVNMIMLGRGLIRNPMLAVGIQQGSERLPTKDQLRHFHDLIYFDYKNTMPNDIVVLYEMKEIWGFMVDIFSEHEPYSKMIKKASSLVEYDVFVNRLFRECQLG